MSMGMMMLSPMMISMPFKLMLFVLVDGWTLIMGSLTGSLLFVGANMDAAQVIDLGRESLWIAVLVAAPLLGCFGCWSDRRLSSGDVHPGDDAEFYS